MAAFHEATNVEGDADQRGSDGKTNPEITKSTIGGHGLVLATGLIARKVLLTEVTEAVQDPLRGDILAPVS